MVLNNVNDSEVLEEMNNMIFKNLGYVTNNVLVTTRYESVITHESIYKHKLPLLSEEDGWALMCKLLFNDGEKGNMQHFEQIGKKMVNKCHGLPLSIKTIARILNAKEKNISEWENVLENIIVSLEPSETLPKAIYLFPFENLSPYIKQCFIFCAFFPKDYILEKNIVTQQWIVVGLVKKPSISLIAEEMGENILMTEDVANDYYMELLESNILQPAAECLYYDGEAMCRMDKNLHSFGRHLAKNYGYFQGDVETLGKISSSSSSSDSAPKLHHLVITNHALLDVFPNIVKRQTSVRTLIFTSKLEIIKLPKDLCQKLKLLRILDISGSDCEVLPKSLFKLVHLHHLNLSCLPIKTLPDTLGNLINLQYLILRYCGSLLDLPEGITRLHKLKSINLHQTPLMGMPIGISKLSQLTSLIGFVASDSTSFCRLEEIRRLKELRTINIVNLEVVDVPYSEIFPIHIHLTDVTLSCGGEDQLYEEGEKEKVQKFFEVLSPWSKLIQHIKINGYFGLEFPRWIMNLPFNKLKRLDLLKCKYCKKLPPLYQFPLLEHLRVEDAWSIKHIKLDIEPWRNFPRLRSLILQDMPEWEEWTWEPSHRSHFVMPVLESLEIVNCPKLKSLPQGLAYHAKSLATLTIYKAHSLEKVEGFTSVKIATFFSNHSLYIISGFPTTCNFEIDDCPKLDVTLLPQTSSTDAC
ncbi:putative disease resistance RPP13-like protein 1 [Dioscorea cayenensis subsp. rotundata]|uniref:Disease resistance RPP13-like protein 1 n=1 Tax=Dioscorea cayennensis subsp. rotundata TaxID=55577 RepID=A0AB40D2T0_DIOCR|nr:putative disease resistance RPP13-like protein 1 [Dioscorea cayenensis subsp. rotundata]